MVKLHGKKIITKQEWLHYHYSSPVGDYEIVHIMHCQLPIQLRRTNKEGNRKMEKQGGNSWCNKNNKKIIPLQRITSYQSNMLHPFMCEVRKRSIYIFFHRLFNFHTSLVLHLHFNLYRMCPCILATPILSSPIEKGGGGYFTQSVQDFFASLQTFMRNVLEKERKVPISFKRIKM